MSTPMPQISDVVIVLGRFPQGATADEIGQEFAPPLPPKTIQLWLKMLTAKNRVVCDGSATGPRYLLPELVVAEPPAVPKRRAKRLVAEAATSKSAAIPEPQPAADDAPERDATSDTDAADSSAAKVASSAQDSFWNTLLAWELLFLTLLANLSWSAFVYFGTRRLMFDVICCETDWFGTKYTEALVGPAQYLAVPIAGLLPLFILHWLRKQAGEKLTSNDYVFTLFVCGLVLIFFGSLLVPTFKEHISFLQDTGGETHIDYR